jgi:hypothetical protein
MDKAVPGKNMMRAISASAMIWGKRFSLRLGILRISLTEVGRDEDGLERAFWVDRSVYVSVGTQSGPSILTFVRAESSYSVSTPTCGRTDSTYHAEEQRMRLRRGYGLETWTWWA